MISTYNFTKFLYWTRGVSVALLMLFALRGGFAYFSAHGALAGLAGGLISAAVVWRVLRTEFVARWFAKALAAVVLLRVADYRHRRRSFYWNDVAYTVYCKTEGLRYFRGAGMLGHMNSINYLNGNELTQVLTTGTLGERFR